MNNYFKYTMKNIVEDKAKSILNIISITLSIIIVMVIMLISQSFKTYMFNQLNVSKNNYLIQIVFGNSVNRLNGRMIPIITDENLKDLKKSNELNAVLGIRIFLPNKTIINNKTTDNYEVYATDFKIINELKLSWLKSNNEEKGVIIGSDIATKNNVKINDTIKIQYDGKNLEAPVVGIINKQKSQMWQSFSLNDVIILDPSIDFAKSVKYSTAFIEVKSNLDISKVSKDIETSLNNQPNIKNDLSGLGLEAIASSNADVVNQLNKWFFMVNIFVYIVTIILIVLVFIKMISLITASINENKKDIALLKVIGGETSQVTLLTILDTLSINIISTFISIIISFIIYFTFIKYVKWKFIFDYKIIIVIIIIGIVVPVIISIFSIKKISKIKPSILLSRGEYDG